MKYWRSLFIVVLTASSIEAQTKAGYRELPADQQVIHALSRLTFGARPGDVQKVRAMGLDKWVDLQLHPERIDDASLNEFLGHYDILKQDQNDLLRDFSQEQRDRRTIKREAGDTGRAIQRRDGPMNQSAMNSRRAVVQALQSARVARALSSDRQLEEVMTDFWLNHFNVFAQKGPPQPFFIPEFEQAAIRRNALGKFRDLLGSVAKSPAMLFYLDNARSMADSSRPRLVASRRGMQRTRQPRSSGLNENYGRELLELHTLGVDGGYTQKDVIDVARALTGWTIRPPAAGGGFVFRPEMHDAGEKMVLGHRLAANRGIEDGEEVLDIVARHPATARYIATRLARRFVSDNPPQALVDRAAATFMKTDGDIREVVRTIITSNEFYSQQAFRSKVKSPFEVVVSALRAMNAVPDSTPRTAQLVARLGEPLYGHQAPNGYAETGDTWMNAGAILNRINFGMAAAANRIPGASVLAIPGIDSVASASRAKQVDAVVSLLLGGSVSPDTRAVLMSGENPLAGKGETGRERLTGIAQVVGLAIGSPEFQRR
jgi:uncharacterized protein (DUF1800 family)